MKTNPDALRRMQGLCGALALLLGGPTAAQDGPRDPMQAPPALRPATALAGSAAADAAPVVARHLMVVDGVRYLIDNGRRLGVGDLLGGARIERIDDSAVLVRQGRQLQRLPLFAGVVKRSVAEPATGPTAARPGDKPTHTAQALVPCADRPSCMQRPGEPR